MEKVVQNIRPFRPLFLLVVVLLYALGAGIARYLGETIDWGIYFLGQAWVTALQIAAVFLAHFFSAQEEIARGNRSKEAGAAESSHVSWLTPANMFILAATFLTIVASLSVIFIQSGLLNYTFLPIIVLLFLGAVSYSVPPLRLVNSGYGELLVSILVANFVPAFAFLLQTGNFHRLLAMSTFPLTALYLAMLLALELPGYAADIKYERTNLMVRIGWQRGMNLHNILMLSAFLLLALAVSFGLPVFISLPAFLPLPLGILQIWQLRRIASGVRPNWRALTMTSVIIFAAMTYLLTFAFWTR